MNDELNALRREIDGIDAELVTLLKRRMAAAAEIAALKGANGLTVLDSERERALLARIRELAGEEFSGGFESIYRAILAASRAYQNTLLGREYDRGGKTMICGLLGEKLGHSYSPQIHAELGDYEYRLFERAPDELDAFFAVNKRLADKYGMDLEMVKKYLPADQVKEQVVREKVIKLVADSATTTAPVVETKNEEKKAEAEKTEEK